MKAERMLPEMGDGLTFRAEEKKGGLVDSGWGGPERNQPGRAHPGAGARGHLEEPWATVSGQLRGWTGASVFPLVLPDAFLLSFSYFSQSF